MSTPKAKGRMGRPLGSRAVVGYDSDLGYLRRLHSACYDDSRITTGEYDKISEAVKTIATILRKLPHA